MPSCLSRHFFWIKKICKLPSFLTQRSRRQRDTNDDFKNLQIYWVLNHLEVLIGVGFAYVCSWGECTSVL
jgi:hypothetical protein